MRRMSKRRVQVVAVSWSVCGHQSITREALFHNKIHQRNTVAPRMVRKMHFDLFILSMMLIHRERLCSVDADDVSSPRFSFSLH